VRGGGGLGVGGWGLGVGATWCGRPRGSSEEPCKKVTKNRKTMVNPVIEERRS
jgi:hypothetical protein